MGPRISSKKMVSNAQKRMNYGPNNAEIPRMRDHILSRRKTVGDDELVTCPKCDAEVDVEEDDAVVR
jgi:hypothetical protein